MNRDSQADDDDYGDEVSGSHRIPKSCCTVEVSKPRISSRKPVEGDNGWERLGQTPMHLNCSWYFRS